MTSSTEATATATIANLNAGIGLTAATDPFIASLFGLSATTITSTSTANAGGLTGTSSIVDLMLTGSAFNAALGSTTLADLYAAAAAGAAPNTSFTFDGLTIVLNEQLFSGDSVTTNAIDVMFNGFPVGTGFKSGNLIFASTSASFPGAGANVGAVPEPATWAMMLLGFGAVGSAMRRSRRKNSKLLQLA